MRVAITRFRAAVSFFSPMTADADRIRIKQEIGWLNASLGVMRDSDVVVDYARRKRYRKWAKHRAGPNVVARQMRDRQRLARCLRSVRFQRLVAQLSGWIASGPWLLHSRQRKPAKPLTAFCIDRLERWRKRLARKGHDLETADASRRHRVRILAKRYRYILEALTDLGVVRDQDAVRRARKSAERLQRALGDLRDLERFARVNSRSPNADGGQGEHRPPGYRQKRRKLLVAARTACRRLRHAGAR